MSELGSRIFTSPVDETARAFSAMPPAWRVHPKANIVGGVLAALVSLPLSMGLGALALAPFGPEYANAGVLAGLYSAAFMGLVAVLMGARGAAVYAPRSIVSFMVASVSAHLFLDAEWVRRSGDPATLTAAIFLLMSLAGTLQLAFGLARLSRVVKFIPTPVMAGFQNSAAISIMFAQIPVMLGIPDHLGLADWPAALGHARVVAPLVAAATLLVLFRARRVSARVPPLVQALAAGVAIYYVLAALGLGAQMGGTLGAIPARIPDGRELGSVIALAMVPGFVEALPGIVLGAVSIALVASLDVLISAKIVETLSHRRGNSTQELISIGAANMVTPLLGGISGSISLSATTTSMHGGGRNSLALLVHGTLFLLMVPILAPAISHIPRVVIAAILFHAGMMLFDRWTLELVRRVAGGRAIHWLSISVDLAVIVLVAAVALAGQVVAAVLIGVAIAIIVFTLRMSRSVIRREQYGDVVQSRRARNAQDLGILAAHGRAILAIELEGPMFFASAEALHNRIDAALAERVRFVVIDFARVTELDSTGARILLQARDRLHSAGCHMILCGAEARPELASLLVSHRVAEAVTRERMFADLDRALEWCENDLLDGLRDAGAAAAEFPIERLDIFRDVEAGDREALREVLLRREYQPGETVFRQGDDGDALYVICHGSADVVVGAPAAGDRRLMTFSQGTFFGEMALLDRERRSATVIADERLVCYVLERSAFERFAAAHPQGALAIITNLGREISLRMRRANRTLLELV